ncbi:MAG TPA: hypothetical protein VGV36_01335 [Solirubrobacteraceae bacterium]|nr:hypothetical protein [Solirubrobacteraceae bacterium]
MLVVARGLPSRYPDRASLLTSVSAPGVQAVAFPPEELVASLASRDPRVEELGRQGVYLAGEQELRSLLHDAAQDRSG